MFDPLFADFERRQVGFREVAVIGRVLFRTHRVGLAFLLVPQPRFLRDLSAGLQNRDLAVDLVFNGLLQEPQGVDVFDLRPDAELRLASATHRDVRVAAQIAFFHVAVAYVYVLQRAAQAVDVIISLPARTEIRLADDFEQRRARAVEVDIRLAGIADVVNRFAGVLFDVGARDSEPLGTPFGGPSAVVALAGQNLDRAM